MAHVNSFQIHIGLVLVQTVLLEMRERMRYKIKKFCQCFYKKENTHIEPNLTYVSPEASLECSLHIRHCVRTWRAGDPEDTLSQRPHMQKRQNCSSVLSPRLELPVYVVQQVNIEKREKEASPAVEKPGKAFLEMTTKLSPKDK